MKVRPSKTLLPLSDAAFDVALSSIVFKKGNAELMLSEIVRVARPGVRAGIIVCAFDMPLWVNLPLDPELKAKADALLRPRPRRVIASGRYSDDGLAYCPGSVR